MNTQRTTLEAVNRSNALYHDSPLRRAGMIVGAGALMLVLSALIVVPTVRADEITVEDGLVAENATDGQCSLIEAIQAANTNSPVGGCNGGSADDTIILAVGGTYILTETYASDTGLPIITSTITFEGNRATIRRDRDSSDNFRILQVGDGLGGAYPGNLTLNNVTIAGGRLDSADSLHGGGIFSSAGGSSLSIHNSTIKDNVAGGSGGGIYAPDSLTMTNSTVYSNTGGGPIRLGRRPGDWHGDDNQLHDLRQHGLWKRRGAC